MLNSYIMRNLMATAAFMLISAACANAQNSSAFKKTIYNHDYDLYIVINAVDKNVKIPGQEFMGEMVGYLGDYKDYRKWLILDATPEKDNALNLLISNDEGSEDLEATLTCTSDSTYTLRQQDGSTLKIARNRKWQKLPTTLTFKTKRK